MNSPLVIARNGVPGQVQVVRGRQAEVLLGDPSSGSSASASSLSVGVVEVAGGVAPGAEVVLVEDDAVPVDEVDRLVVGLDLAVGGLAAEVLERGEPDERVGAVGSGVSFLEGGVAVDEPPAVEVDVAEQVVAPRVWTAGL